MDEMNTGTRSIRYIASNTYAQVIHSVVTQTGILCVGQEVTEGFALQKFVKQNLPAFSSLDMFLIDLSALADVDDEIISAIEMIRYLDDGIRIIILAANRYKGDSLLRKCFTMGIYNIVCTDDFLEIAQELTCCVTDGKKYKDAQEFKEAAATDRIVVKQEIKQTVNKIFIAVAGSQKRMGVTHVSIMLAAYLRKRGYMVAIAEMNDSGDFAEILDGYDEQMIENYFNIDGIDFYPGMDAEKLSGVLAKSYNFVIGDFGSHRECDSVTFSKGDVRIILSGAKAWETGCLSRNIFQSFPEEALKEINFVFNLTDPDNRRSIQEGMQALGEVYFQEYAPDPFTPEFPAAEKILKRYMPVKVEEKKKRFFGRRG